MFIKINESFKMLIKNYICRRKKKEAAYLSLKRLMETTKLSFHE